MSHKASCWLATVPADSMSGSAFRVMFHLCDAHNALRDPESACFPSQRLLMDRTGLSNGGLNNALRSLEQAGLLVRRRTRRPDGTQGPTYYILGCDFDKAPPSPQNGGGGNGSNSADCDEDDAAIEDVDPESGDVSAPAKDVLHSGGVGGVTDSNLGHKPTPFQGTNRLHSSGVKPVIDPVNKPMRAQAPARERPHAREAGSLDAPAKLIRTGKPFLCASISAHTARRCVQAGLVTTDDCERANIRL